MKTRIEHLEDLRVFYTRFTGPYGLSNYNKMASFKNQLQTNHLLNEEVTIIGIPWDSPTETPEKQCRYDLCIIASEAQSCPQGMLETSLSLGKYIVFLLPHTRQAIIDFYQHIPTYLSEHGVAIDHGPIVERYKQKDLKRQKCELLVPIK